MPFAGNIYYFASKKGSAARPPVVLIHGAGGTHLHWPHNIRRLPDYRVYAPDLPGHGKSEGLGHQTVRGYASAILDWLHEIGVFWAVFVGHSMGSAIAQTLALEHGERVLGLGLVGAGARLRVNPDLLEKLSRPGAFENAVDWIVKWSYAEGAKPKEIRRVREQLASNRPAVLHGDYLACDSFDVMGDLERIAAPTCIISGSDDQMTPPKYAQYLADRIPNASLTMVPGAGHMVMLEKPEAVAAALEAFLETVPFPR